ncbi:MAG TPA: ATP-binding protein [Cyanobacteria bacterium UBA11369]|nr:ATP-binding protein [Cyanobacteria bacterium UBA11371]HBE33192.1 ATP-binding protein [Cyanobacteria bacterium UBA11368]HBE53879.1 ATP-binding protein [Cyanobacteria bacterium UBA11369]
MLQQEHLTVKTDINRLIDVLQWFDRFCDRNLSRLSWLGDESGNLNLAVDMLKLALDEGFTNAVRHAHKDLPPETPIDLELTLWAERLEIRIWDRGEPFDPPPLKAPDPDKLSIGGYGWFLIRRIADNVVHSRDADGRNCLLIVKYKRK